MLKKNLSKSLLDRQIFQASKNNFYGKWKFSISISLFKECVKKLSEFYHL